MILCPFGFASETQKSRHSGGRLPQIFDSLLGLFERCVLPKTGISLWFGVDMMTRTKDEFEKIPCGCSDRLGLASKTTSGRLNRRGQPPAPHFSAPYSSQPPGHYPLTGLRRPALVNHRGRSIGRIQCRSRSGNTHHGAINRWRTESCPAN